MGAWGAAVKTEEACSPLLTSSCVARFLTGHRLEPGVGDPGQELAVHNLTESL